VRGKRISLRLTVICLVSLTLAVEALAAEPQESDPRSLGAYLASAGNCVSCHTQPGGKPFAGGFAFQTPFGVLYSTNITPHSSRGIGSWTEQEFMQAMREGIGKNGEHLYPAFPYQNFTKLEDTDLRALWIYLRSLEPVDYQPPANELRFPFKMRFLIGGWKVLFFKADRFTTDPGQSQEWNRGAYLVEGLGHCGACHTPRNFLGAEKSSQAMTGGVYADKVSPKTVRKWSTANLTQASTGLAAWSTEDIAAYLRTGHSSRAGTFGPMNEVIVNSTSRLSTADVHAMATYLKSLPANNTTGSHRPDRVAQRSGENLYTVHCGTCHLPTGLGSPDTGPPVAGSAIVQAPDAAALINVILYGAEVPQPAPAEAWKSMESFQSKLSDKEVATLANYLRATFGNQGGRVHPRDVAAQR
jgi:mono/diheme cytochrome c family protein